MSTVEIGIMIEGQEDLTWERLFRLAKTVEDSGLAHLFRSDHLTPLEHKSRRQTLALWPSLTALAIATKRIRFGPMVAAVTFRQPAMVAKMAAAVSELAGGRFDLGLGAGWYAQEHRMFGLPYPRYGRRLEMLAEAAALIQALGKGKRISYAGEYYRLEEALTLPRPITMPIIMGGKGEKTLRVVARFADEWNFSYGGIELFRQKSSALDADCIAIDRDPGSLRRSIMVPFVIGRDETAVQAHISAHRRMFPSLPGNLTDWHAAGFPGGVPDQVAAQIGTFVEAGATRFMLQQNDLDDMESIYLLAEALLPQLSDQE